MIMVANQYEKWTEHDVAFVNYLLDRGIATSSISRYIGCRFDNFKKRIQRYEGKQGSIRLGAEHMLDRYLKRYPLFSAVKKCTVSEGQFKHIHLDFRDYMRHFICVDHMSPSQVVIAMYNMGLEDRLPDIQDMIDYCKYVRSYAEKSGDIGILGAFYRILSTLVNPSSLLVSYIPYKDEKKWFIILTPYTYRDKTPIFIDIMVNRSYVDPFYTIHYGIWDAEKKKMKVFGQCPAIKDLDRTILDLSLSLSTEE